MARHGTFGGPNTLGFEMAQQFDARAYALALTPLSLDDATEILMKEFNQDAATCKSRIYRYRKGGI